MVTRKTDKPYRGKANLDVIFSDTELSSNTINIKNIVLPKQQPRRYFDSEKLEQLILSIKQHGILEPLLVRPLSEGKYELIAGERRYRASQSLGLIEIPVVIKEITDEEALQVALIENLQREDLNPIEETEGFLQLLSIQLNLSISDVIAQLYRMQNEKVRVNGNVSIHNESTVIIQLFESLAIK
ncbi:chromosome (plasmid) partitioning protein ParB [Geminocystis sp. NIES-3708]|uniref:ParB/RepB/Spo0J family partition protein n=1 Tax=Geminocystis sp. NIES-3708 TaxID=1615909 RepID=UPI0005FCC509|nr:ParB/RepB/Spo0J family partition protein [Geminocystis sp. NIES-3708]BAQ61138.1 chromosome (plasmid) partitioning protein ParB [Geminocystis sp. NIES-3708]